MGNKIESGGVVIPVPLPKTSKIPAQVFTQAAPEIPFGTPDNLKKPPVTSLAQDKPRQIAPNIVPNSQVKGKAASVISAPAVPDQIVNSSKVQPSVLSKKDPVASQKFEKKKPTPPSLTVSPFSINQATSTGGYTNISGLRVSYEQKLGSGIFSGLIEGGSGTTAAAQNLLPNSIKETTVSFNYNIPTSNNNVFNARVEQRSVKTGSTQVDRTTVQATDTFSIPLTKDGSIQAYAKGDLRFRNFNTSTPASNVPQQQYRLLGEVGFKAKQKIGSSVELNEKVYGNTYFTAFSNQTPTQLAQVGGEGSVTYKPNPDITASLTVGAGSNATSSNGSTAGKSNFSYLVLKADATVMRIGRGEGAAKVKIGAGYINQSGLTLDPLLRDIDTTVVNPGNQSQRTGEFVITGGIEIPLQ